jgi:hypothetical protein
MDGRSKALSVAIWTLCLACVGCMRTIHVTKQMTWEPAPDEFNPAFYARPDEYVRFRFVENPHCLEVVSARDLSAQLSRAGKSVVRAEFEVWGDFLEVQGHNMLAVDGRPLQTVGGWGHSGSADYMGPCPLDLAMRSAR